MYFLIFSYPQEKSKKVTFLDNFLEHCCLKKKLVLLQWYSQIIQKSLSERELVINENKQSNVLKVRPVDSSLIILLVNKYFLVFKLVAESVMIQWWNTFYDAHNLMYVTSNFCSHHKAECLGKLDSAWIDVKRNFNVLPFMLQPFVEIYMLSCPDLDTGKEINRLGGKRAATWENWIRTPPPK